MKTKEQLLLELKKLELKEKEDKNRELLDKNIYKKGTCWSTHMFGNNYKLVSGSIVSILDVIVGNEGLLFSTEQIFISVSEKGFYMSLMKYSNFHRSDFSGNKYQIPLSRFNQIKLECEAHVENFIPILKSLKTPPGVLISMGGSCEDQKNCEFLKQVGLSMIELENKDVINILSWNHHPFLYRDFLLNTPESLKIIKIISDNLKENGRIWGGCIAQRDMQRAFILDEFLNSIK